MNTLTTAATFNTQSSFTVKNEVTGWTKSNMSFADVRKFHFNKMSKNGFDTTCLVDLVIIDEANGYEFRMSNMVF